MGSHKIWSELNKVIHLMLIKSGVDSSHLANRVREEKQEKKEVGGEKKWERKNDRNMVVDSERTVLASY